MIYFGKFNLLRIKVTACDYNYVVEKIINAAKENTRLTIAPIASHPIVDAHFNKSLRDCLNQLDLVIPDSQYIRWAINFLYNVKLTDRVYGPELFIKICQEAERKNIKVFVYGNNVTKLKKVLKKLFPNLLVFGIDLQEKPVDDKEATKLLLQIKRTGCQLLFVGLSSPLQHEIVNNLQDFDYPIVAVGAAFDFISGVKPQAPKWMQKVGLEWLFRLLNEPQRLWKRYLIYGPLFILLVIWQKASIVLFNLFYKKTTKG